MFNFIIKHYKVVLLNTYDADAGCGLWLRRQSWQWLFNPASIISVARRHLGGEVRADAGMGSGTAGTTWQSEKTNCVNKFTL